MSRTIHVGEDTHAALVALKADDETFDELLHRLLENRRQRVRGGAGLWEDTDAAERARSGLCSLPSG